jgi:hypothetical protein
VRNSSIFFSQMANLQLEVVVLSQIKFERLQLKQQYKSLREIDGRIWRKRVVVVVVGGMVLDVASLIFKKYFYHV